MKRLVPVFFWLVLPVVGLSQTDASQGANAPAYRVGVGVKPPRGLDNPDPVFPEEGRKKHQNEIVVLRLTVAADGSPRDIKVQRSVDPQIDEIATETVEKWKFAPATKDDKPVAVLINIQIRVKP